jgi:hypothetical protein
MDDAGFGYAMQACQTSTTELPASAPSSSTYNLPGTLPSLKAIGSRSTGYLSWMETGQGSLHKRATLIAELRLGCLSRVV